MTQQQLSRIGAIAPIAMSLTAFLLVMGAALFVGVTREPDEGTGAHIFQLLIAGQVPFGLLFLATADWQQLPRVAGVLALQIAAVVLAFAPVAYYGL